jgi:glutamate-1-semialdehyde 2,1-aminomutase
MDRGDVAAVILEPAGGQAGTTPLVPGFLQEIRTQATRRNVVLIFDEVITGFRYAPGGAQAYFGVTPDLTTFAKILAGGLPGGAVAGKREIMQLMAHRGDPSWDRTERVAQQGTFNANPLSAVAGIATLETIADGSLQARASKLGEELRSALSDVMRRAGAPGTVFGEASIYHLSFEGRPGFAGFDRPRRTQLYQVLRCALLNSGVDCSLYHGWVSAVHTEEDLAQTVQGYERALSAMAADGWFGGM